MRYRVTVPVLVPTSAHVDVEAESAAGALAVADSMPSVAWTVADVSPRPTDLDIEVDGEAEAWPVNALGELAEP